MTTTTQFPATGPHIELDGSRNVWPMGPRNRHWRGFHPRGYLVAVFDSAEGANSAVHLLSAAGFKETDLRTYLAGDVLRVEEQRAARGFADRLLGALGDNDEAFGTQVANARKGKVALWIRVRNRTTASHTMRQLVDQRVLQYQYFGSRMNEYIVVG
jgi:hypothetical protein